LPTLVVRITVLEFASTFVAASIKLVEWLVAAWGLASSLVGILFEVEISLVEIVVLLKSWLALTIVEIWHLFSQMVRRMHFLTLIIVSILVLLCCWASYTFVSMTLTKDSLTFLPFKDFIHRVVRRIIRLCSLVEAFSAVRGDVE
jgi:hypothetical protein